MYPAPAEAQTAVGALRARAGETGSHPQGRLPPSVPCRLLPRGRNSCRQLIIRSTIKTPPPPTPLPPQSSPRLLPLHIFVVLHCLSSHLLPLRQYPRNPARAVVPPTKPHLSCRFSFSLPFPRNRVAWEGSSVPELGAFPARSWCHWKGGRRREIALRRARSGRGGISLRRSVASRGVWLLSLRRAGGARGWWPARRSASFSRSAFRSGRCWWRGGGDAPCLSAASAWRHSEAFAGICIGFRLSGS